jgi:hypothetical protein
MEYTIKSRKLKREVTFSRPGSYYIHVNLNGQPGCLGQQICKNGALSGSCLGVSDGRNDQETQEAFERVCKAWWKNYCAQYDADYLY